MEDFGEVGLGFFHIDDLVFWEIKENCRGFVEENFLEILVFLLSGIGVESFTAVFQIFIEPRAVDSGDIGFAGLG